MDSKSQNKVIKIYSNFLTVFISFKKLKIFLRNDVFNEWPILKAKIIRNNIQVPKKNIIHSFNKQHTTNKKKPEQTLK